MLYDPKWEQQVKVDTHSLEGVIAWLEKQPADRVYNYANCAGACLLGQYMSHIGIDWYGDGSPYVDFCKRFESQGIDIQRIAGVQPYTFDAALERARKVQARRT